MKRHPALAHLSREHHGALILARLLQANAPAYNDLPKDTDGKALYALQFYKNELVKHFGEEEKALKLVVGTNERLDSLVQEIFLEHQELHSSFQSVSGRADTTVYLDKLGKALETHIRKEERELFPLIQESCGEEIMKAIDNTLSHS